jgi:hypothetical protein
MTIPHKKERSLLTMMIFDLRWYGRDGCEVARELGRDGLGRIRV